MFSSLLTAAAIMTGVALFFGVVLATAYRFLRVEEDPRIDAIEEMLPGTNCGACGQPGCRAFAEVVVDGASQPSGCTVSSPEGIVQIANYLGVDAGERDKVVARLHCGGGRGLVQDLAEYSGLSSCRAAVVVNQGGTACAWGCLGLADCERACTFDAISMNVKSLPVVEPDLCTACGDCVDVCPRDIFSLQPQSEMLVVQCASPLAGDLARDICSVACDACGRCALDAPPGVIEMVDGLPVIRVPSEGIPDATFRCPTGAIQWIEDRQFETEPEPDVALVSQSVGSTVAH